MSELINRKTRRRLAKDINRTVHHVSSVPRELIELQKALARPLGCSFLGARATEVKAYVNQLSEELISIIIDSGSDITLISQQTLDRLLSKPKIRLGQRINLIQVTGKAVINGFVVLDLYFPTTQGVVKINVEAYMVKGMTTPFILGNDFADQYSLSIIRDQGSTRLQFGNSGRCVDVQNSLSHTGPKDEEGHTFKVHKRPDYSVRISKAKTHRRKQTFQQKQRRKTKDNSVRSQHNIWIAPETTKIIAVELDFKGDSMYIERYLTNKESLQIVYGCPEMLIDYRNPRIYITNFSKVPVTIYKGEIVSYASLPEETLNKTRDLSPAQQLTFHRQAQFISNMSQMQSDLSTAYNHTQVDKLTDMSKRIIENDRPGDPSIQGGPKTAYAPEPDMDQETFKAQIDINNELTNMERQIILETVWEKRDAFSIEGHLGNYPGEVEVPLIPGSKPISIPPFNASPEKRGIIDKQMDSWLSLGVIETSKSPWAAPVFIVQRNNKSRMVIDLRRLNEQVIPDEFPLPCQEDILQSLEGCQYLSTLDALSGFTQLTVKESDREKLAFRTHRGLFQFTRMPFGFRNGPAVFQRVMQEVLAPYLWIFALVYIDDIVIFSKTFEEHVHHINLVLGAIQEAKITLSPSKCHFGYQSILLLGQKVSRLGLSTHKEKVDAITELDYPRNVHELQVFLGMMVYFSSYIPYYAWIVHPLFQLLKKENKWKWDKEESLAFDLCKEVLTQAPVRAHAMPGRPYRIYSDACDFALAAILQQVQPIQIGDLKGTKVYERLEKAHQNKEGIPILIQSLSKDYPELPESNTSWAENFDDTIVYVERVIAYWSRVLQSAERNYSPTEREALALKEGLIKFQPLLEGESIYAITDHAALTWSKTFQNVNRRLLTWGLVFSAFPNMKIIHRAGRIHSNVDPISRLRRRVPTNNGPITAPIEGLSLKEFNSPLKHMYDEFGPRFEEKLLTVAAHYAESEHQELPFLFNTRTEHITFTGSTIQLPYVTAQNYSTLISINQNEISEWVSAYATDKHFSAVQQSFRSGVEDNKRETFPQYLCSEEGLIYFIDSMGNTRLCVPQVLRLKVMKEKHDIITEAAHGGYFKTYNQISSNYYWPQMSRQIKKFIATCDICQKTKPRRHGPIGQLHPIPIPARPFEVISMDFIPELPESNGYDNILVIVDKLTKYGIFIPTNTTITKYGTAKLFFKHVVSKFGLPRQIISDRDPRWSGDFWKEVCRLMGTNRALTTAYHPQADGQTEVLNQTLEIAIRAYIGPSRDNWENTIDALAMSYNTAVHTSTGYSPAYLLRGYQPLTATMLDSSSQEISSLEADRTTREPSNTGDFELLDAQAQIMMERFVAERNHAKDALLIGQIAQQKYYNQGRLTKEFEEGDVVLINRQNLGLMRTEKGRGNKLLPKYDGPFEVAKKLSPVTYRLRLPLSYGIHPVLNISHLEKYVQSPPEYGIREAIPLQRPGFDEQTEVEVDKIVAEKWTKGPHGRRVPRYRLRYVGYGPEDDEWVTRQGMRNAPEILQEWNDKKNLLKERPHGSTRQANV